MATATESGTPGIKLRGSDTLLTELPLDVLVQIIGWLHPWDILMLSRTTKSFRRYLMSRTSRATIWVPALKTLDDLDIPKCPETMSEPRFIHLLYGNVCDECRAVKGTKIIAMYEIQSLLCRNCLLQRYAPLRAIVNDNPFPWGARDLDDMGVDYMHGSHWMTELTWEKDDPDKQDDESPRLYHIDSIVYLQTRWGACQQDGNAKNILAQEATREYEEQQSWASNCRGFLRREEREARLREARVQNERREKEERMRKEREEKVKERLIALGYKEEVNSFFSTDRYSHIANPSAHYTRYKEKFSGQSAELTDDEWNNIKDDMVNIMLAERHWWEVFMGGLIMKDLIDSTFKPSFVAYAFSQPPNTVLPSPKEVALMPEWVEALSTGTSEEGLDRTLVAAAVAAMPAFCDGIREWRIEQVLDLVRKSKTYSGRENDVSFDVLTLASTVFSCKACDDCMTYPNVLVHGCNYAERSRQHFGTVGIPDTAKVIERVGEPATWSTRPLATPTEGAIAASMTVYSHFGEGSFWNDLCNVSFDDAGHEHMVNLLSSLGMDRETSAQDLGAHQPYVEGLCQCFKVGASSAKDSEPRTVMRWLKAIQSCRSHDVPEKRKNWFAKPSKAYLALVSEAEATRRSDHSIQACFWSLGGRLLEVMPRRLYAEGEGRWKSRFNLSKIVHPEGADAAREYAEARNLEAFARLVDEKPLQLTVRRSSRKRSDDSHDSGLA